MAKDKFYQFTISGSYHNSKKEICDYEGVVVKVPFTELEEIAVMHLQSRYAMVAIRNDERYKEDRVHHLRQVFVDKTEIVEGNLSFVGKDLKELTDEEMQDLATAKDLRGIPLPKQQSSMSLRDMRVLTYIAYSEKVLGKEIDSKTREEITNNFAKQPSIIVDGAGRVETTGKVSNDEMIEDEQRNTGEGSKPEDRFTLIELKTLARQKQISFDENTKDEKKLFNYLYGKLYA